MEFPELILPAGSPEKMRFAFQYGADAVYVGLAPFSLRARVNDFNQETILEGVDYAHKLGKKVYVTSNIYPHNMKIEPFKHHIKWLRDEVKPDAVIVADVGVFHMLREYFPEAKIHISVQANCVNYMDVKFWKELGAKRVILSRELSLNEIKEIKDQVPEMEIECFVHGAICIAYSGRCLMSNYFTKRDPNQGTCAQSCRWKYKVHLEEEKRPGEIMPLEEDEHGTYLFNSRDLCALPHLQDLIDAGVSGFKVEGRSKSIYYLSTVARTYRKALEDLKQGKPFDPSLMDELKKIAHRGYSPGFLTGTMTHDDIYYEKNEPIQSHKFIGVIRDHKSINGKNMYEVEIRNRIEKGATVEVMAPDENTKSNITEIMDKDKPVEVAHGGAGKKYIELEGEYPVGAFLRQEV